MYVTSERGIVHALDGETGRTLWTTAIGSPQHPTTAAGANDNFVAALNGSQLYMMNSSDGSVVWNRFTVSAPGAGPALSDTLAFVPMINGQIEAYFVDDSKSLAGVFKSFGRVMHQPVASSRSVGWSTDRGYVYVGDANLFDMRFRVEAKDTIDSPPAFLAPDLVFATSLDGYIYCFTEMRGTILWRFTTGEPISHQPVALVDTVYAITDRGNMYAINVEGGTEKWVAAGIKRYLSGNQNRLYCIDTAGNLAILNADSGSVIGTLPAHALDLQVLNVQTDRILVGTRGGLLQCLRETGSYWPVVHYGELKQKKPAAQPRGDKPAAEGDKPAADPFAAPPAADPFAAPPAGADPFAAPRPGAPAAPAAPAAPPAADPFAPPAAGADPFGAP
jgi:outer membrane protein assembly factor BamB